MLRKVSLVHCLFDENFLLMKIGALEERKERKVPHCVSTFVKEIILIFEVVLHFNISSI